MKAHLAAAVTLIILAGCLDPTPSSAPADFTDGPIIKQAGPWSMPITLGTSFMARSTVLGDDENITTFHRVSFEAQESVMRRDASMSDAFRIFVNATHHWATGAEVDRPGNNMTYWFAKAGPEYIGGQWHDQIARTFANHHSNPGPLPIRETQLFVWLLAWHAPGADYSLPTGAVVQRVIDDQTLNVTVEWPTGRIVAEMVYDDKPVPVVTRMWVWWHGQDPTEWVSVMGDFQEGDGPAISRTTASPSRLEREPARRGWNILEHVLGGKTYVLPGSTGVGTPNWTAALETMEPWLNTHGGDQDRLATSVTYWRDPLLGFNIDEPVTPLLRDEVLAGLWSIVMVPTEATGFTTVATEGHSFYEVQSPTAPQILPVSHGGPSGVSQTDGYSISTDADLQLMTMEDAVAFAREVDGRGLPADLVGSFFFWTNHEPRLMGWTIGLGCVPPGEQTATVLMIDARTGLLLAGYVHQQRPPNFTACNLADSIMD